MTKTKKYDMKKNAKYRLFIGILFLIIGIVFEIFGVFVTENLGNLSFSKWLIFTGILLLIIGIKNSIFGKEVIYDERSQMIINKSLSFTMMFLVYGFLILFIIGMIKSIKIDLSLFVSYVIFVFIIVNLLAKYYYNKKL